MASRNGYPTPGPQSHTPQQIMEEKYFVDESDWEALRDGGNLDYIVVGSGPTALAFVKQVLDNDRNARIAVLERGDFWLPEHFQNLPLAYKFTLGGTSETFPFTLTEDMVKQDFLKYMHGSCPFFGGRSTFWSAWSPKAVPPSGGEQWPDFLLEKVFSNASEGFWDNASTHLNVTRARELSDAIYGALQYQLEDRLDANKSLIPSADEVLSAPMSVGNLATIGQRFEKFSTPGPLLALYERQKELENLNSGAPLNLVLRCVVQKLNANADGNQVVSIQSSRGEIKVGKAKVILAMGCIPPCTLLLNSFPQNETIQKLAGSRLTGHVVSHVTARISRKHLKDLSPGLELGALYVGGKHPASHGQYHVQVTAIANPDPERYAQDASRECPDFAAAATPAQLKGSEDYVLFVCAALGEIMLSNDNWVKLDPNNQDPTCNVKLQVKINANDLELWGLMEEATVQTIKAMATNARGVQAHIEFWHDDADLAYHAGKRRWRIKGNAPAGHWRDEVAPPSKLREPGAVHEASCLWMGRDKSSSVVDSSYRPHGVENVYVTGGSLFPTSGSWNPTLTMVGLAQDLAQSLTMPKQVPDGEADVEMRPAPYLWRMSMDATTDGF